MSPAPVAPPAPVKRFPRVSGDEPDFSLVLQRKTWFSPRERG